MDVTNWRSASADCWERKKMRLPISQTEHSRLFPRVFRLSALSSLTRLGSSFAAKSLVRSCCDPCRPRLCLVCLGPSDGFPCVLLRSPDRLCRQGTRLRAAQRIGLADALPLPSALSLPCRAIYRGAHILGRGGLGDFEMRCPWPADRRAVETSGTD